MVSTEQAIFLTQVPIAVGILIGAYLLYDIKRELVAILERLADNHSKTKK